MKGPYALQSLVCNEAWLTTAVNASVFQRLTLLRGNTVDFEQRPDGVSSGIREILERQESTLAA
jgi:hypothetical protein